MRFKGFFSLFVMLLAVNVSGLLGQDTVKFAGRVKTNSDGMFEVEYVDPATNLPGSIVMTTNAATQVFGEDGVTTISLSDIPVDHYVFGEAHHDSDPAVNMLVADKIFYTGTSLPLPPSDDPPPGPQPGDTFQFGGEITQIGSNYLVLSWHNPETGESGTQTVYFDTAIRILDAAGNDATLAVGDFIDGEAEIQSDGTVKALSITKFFDGPQPGEKFQFGGQITEIGSNYLVTSWHNPDTGESGTDRVSLNSSTRITYDNGNTATLVVDYFVDGEAEVQSDGSVLALSITVYPPGPLPGEKHQIGGQIAEVGSNYLVLSWDDPETGKSGSETVYFNAATIFTDESGNDATPVVGYYIDGEAEVQSDGTSLALSITLFPPGPLPGDRFLFVAKILSIDSDSIEVEVYDDDDKVHVEKVQRDPSVPVTDKDGNPATLDVLVAGDYIEGEVEFLEGDEEKVIWIRVLSEEPPLPGEEELPFTGTVVSVGSDYIEIEVTDKDGNTKTLRLTVDTETTLKDETDAVISLSDFASGDEVHGLFDPVPDSGQQFANEIWKGSSPGPGPVEEPVPFGGTIVNVGTDYIELEIRTPEGSTVTGRAIVATETQLMDSDGTALTLADFTVGEEVFGEGIPTENEYEVTASFIQKGAGHEPVFFAGVILEIGAGYIDIEVPSPDGTTVQRLRLVLDEGTVFFSEDGATEIALAELTAGDNVNGEGEPTGNELELLAFHIQKEARLEPVFFAGEILEIGADYIDIEVPSPDGTTVQRLRLVLDEGTVFFSEDGATEIALAELTAGDNVNGEGEPTGNDLELLAFHIQQGTPGPMPGEIIPFSGKLLAFGSDFIQFEYGYDSETGTTSLENFTVDESTSITDENDNAAALETGYFIEGQGEVQTDGTVKADSIRIYFTSVSLPGENTTFVGNVVETGSDFIIIQHELPDGVTIKVKVFVLSGYNVIDSEGNPVSPASLQAEDVVSGEGMRQPCGVIIARLLSKRATPGPGVEIQFSGRVIEVGSNTLVVERAAKQDTITLQVLSETVILDDDEQPVALSDIIPGDIVQGVFIEETDGSLSLVSARIEVMLPRPGEAVSFHARIKSIEASRLLVEIPEPDSPVREVYLNIGAQTIIQDTDGFTLSLADLSPDDAIDVEGTMAADGSMAVDASAITYVAGNILRFFGRVVTLTNEGFDLETRDDQNRAVVLEVILSEATSIVREGTEEVLARDQILKGMMVMVIGPKGEENALQAILVGVPQPERESFGGRVVSIEQNNFVVEVKHSEQDLTLKVTVTTSEATSWLTEQEDEIQPATEEDLALDNFVRVSGVLVGPLTVAADTVLIESVEEFEIMTLTILEGKVEGSVFTFKLNVFEYDPSLPAVLAEVTLNISPDFRNLKGQIIYSDDPLEPDSISLNKITGEPGKLTGRWAGAVDENGGVPVSADIVQTGSSVTGTVTSGGTVEPGTGEGPQAGDEITVHGQVTEVSENSFILSFRDRLNQLIQLPVLFFESTELVDIEGNLLEIPTDSLLKRLVEITGIIQSDFSLVANFIVVQGLDTDQEPSAELPLIANGTWNSADGTLAFDLEADSFDDELDDGLVSLSGQLSEDGNNLYADGMLTNVDSLKMSLRRQSGEPEDPSGSWAGTASTLVSGQLKIWPVFLNLLVKDGALSGNYGVGEGRIKTEIVTQNLPPEIDPFEPVTATEEQQISVTVTAQDPENEQITLTVQGYQIPGSSFTDNGDGTGTYTLTIPRLPEGKTELIVNFAAEDANGAKTSRVLVIKVTRLNRAPELKAVTDTLRLLEGRSFSVVIPARDTDNDPLTFEFAGLPEWAATDNSQITFDPPFGSGGNYSFTVTVRDGKGGEVSRTYDFLVLSINRPPRFVQIEPIESEASTPVSFSVEAVDPDPGDVLTFSVLEVAEVQAIPQGASFDAATGRLDWTPTAEQVGPFKAAFVVTDSEGARDLMAVNIVIGSEAVVGAGAFPPTLDSKDSLAVNQDENLTFTVTGTTNTDRELKFYARNLPRRAGFDATTRTFSWTPDYNQEGNYRLIIGVGDGSFRTEQDVIITVNKVVQVPTLEPLDDQTVTEGELLRFRVTGHYPDGRQVRFDQPTGLPDNSLFDVVTGNFHFLPGYDQAGTYSLTFSVTEDDGTPYSVSTTVTVADNNRSPKLVELKNVSIILGQSIAFDVEAQDPDPGDVLTLEAVEIPQGATFNASAAPAAFSWTPTEEGSYQASFKVTDAAGASDRRTVYIAVGTQNLPPALGDIGDLTISEGDTLSLTISVSDPENDPVSVFANPIPANAAFNSENNTFSFQPSYAQAGTYNLKFFASDGELTDEKPVTIQVLDVSLPPVITVSRAWSVQEGETLEFTVDVRDASGDKVEVISSTLPDGASLVSSSGKFFWAPDFEQSGTYSITFIASDGNQTAQQDIVIAVADRNRAPLIFEIADQEVTEGEIISFEITTTDPDGDQVTVAIDSTETPYIESVDIRNNSVFVFNTTLLDVNLQIPSAVFIITADDGRGGTDRRAIAFKIMRSKDINVPPVDPGGDPFNYNFPGTGFTLNMANQGSSSVSGNMTGSEISGALDTTGQSGPQLAAKYSYLANSKDKVVVMPFLAGDDGNTGDFYGIRRGWGIDLSSDLLTGLQGLTFTLTFQYEDRDIPARDIPEFTETAISIFGLNAQGEFVQLATQLDPDANTATAEADLALYTDFTIGVILDLTEPVIAGTSHLVNTTDELGPYTVSTTIVDNVLVRSAKLYYAIEGQSFQAVEMIPDTLMINGFNGSIPGQKEGNTILYYIEAGDSLHTVTDPVEAPQSAYRFSILLDGVESVRPGDMDNNGKVDIFDLLDLLKILGGTQQASGAADTNGDGKVDIFDLLELLKILAQ